MSHRRKRNCSAPGTRHAIRVPGYFVTPALLVAASLVIGVSVRAQDELADPREPVIHYRSSDGLADAVTSLQKQLAAGKRQLKFEPAHGYLSSLLEALDVPVCSQTLVFSKTSSQDEQTSPRTPRAIYYSQDVYIGWVPGCRVIDIAAMDPERGPVFYTLDQRQEPYPVFKRRFDCLRCHESGRTLQVPGLFVRSTYTGPDGTPLETVREFISGHSSPLERRWAGWYVSGTHVSRRVCPVGGHAGLLQRPLTRALEPGEGEFHLGNLVSSNLDSPDTLDLTAGANRTDLRPLFEAPRYLSRHSDIVALMVLEHQMRMQTLITWANYETRLTLAELRDKAEAIAGLSEATVESPWPKQRVAQAGERLLEYLLFRGEAPLKGPVKGTSSFASEFQRAGPPATGGCSLRQLDLQTRLFRYPCSYLIYSRGFDALSVEMKDYLWRRLDQILEGRDRSEAYATLALRDRRAVFDILRQTKPEFAAWIRHQKRSRIQFDAEGRIQNAEF